MSRQPHNVVQVAAFIKRHWPASRHDTRKDLIHWAGWHMQRQLIVTVADEMGRLCGLAMGRLLNLPTEAATPWLSYETGRLVWIDLVVAKRPEVMPLLLAELERRWGDRRYVAGNVFSRSGELRMFPMNRLQQFFRG